MHTSSQFQGPKANQGHVTHSTQDGKSVLTLSDDFVVPDTPDPHWQLVDSDGNVYLVDKLKTKAFIGNQLQEGNRRAQLCEERVESSDLVRVCRSQSGRGQLQLARQVNSRSSRGARAGSNLDGSALQNSRERKTMNIQMNSSRRGFASWFCALRASRMLKPSKKRRSPCRARSGHCRSEV